MAGNIKTNSVTLGDSATDSQNFQLRTNVDGTATLARGAAGDLGDILTVDASGKVSLPQNLTHFTSVYRTTNQVLASSGIIIFNAALEDVYGDYNLTTGKYVVPVSGIYCVTIGITGATRGQTLPFISLGINGTTRVRDMLERSVLAVNEELHSSYYIRASAGDELYLYAGGAVTIEGITSPGYYSFMQIIKAA